MFVYTPGRFAGNLFFSSASALTGPLPHPNVFGGLRPESSSKEAPAGITVTNVVEPPAPVPPAENFPVEEMIYLVCYTPGRFAGNLFFSSDSVLTGFASASKTFLAAFGRNPHQ